MTDNSSNFFQIGGRYRNRAGFFEVLDLVGGTMTVSMEDGEVCTFDLETQFRIQKNLKKEERSLFPTGVPAENESGFITTVGALARSADFVAEVPIKAIRGFSNSYKSATGELPQGQGYYELHEGADKWGAELRIGFPSHMQLQPWFILPVGVQPAPKAQNGISRINNNSFWWHLVEYFGFQIGASQDLEIIRSRIHPNFIESLEQGIDWQA